MRQGKWKLVSAHGGDWELYDLEADRTELHNVIDQHSKKAETLKAAYEHWAKRCDVQPWPIRKPKG